MRWQVTPAEAYQEELAVIREDCTEDCDMCPVSEGCPLLEDDLSEIDELREMVHSVGPYW